jgi:hypothetical protein
MLEADCLPLFLYYGTLISAVGQGELVWSVGELYAAGGAASIYAGAW